MEGFISVECASDFPITLRANSITAHCMPRQIPKKGIPFSRAYLIVEIFPSIPRFPKPGAKWQVTSNGGVHVRWRRDGKELFYLALDGKLMAVPVRSGDSFEFGTPQALFQAPTVGGATTAGGVLQQQYDVSPDGQRFLMNVPIGGAATSPTITVVLNWTAGLRK